MSKLRELHQKWSRDPDYRRAYCDLDYEFEMARSLELSEQPIARSITLVNVNPVSAGRVLKPLRVDDDLLGEMLDDERD